MSPIFWGLARGGIYDRHSVRLRRTETGQQDGLGTWWFIGYKPDYKWAFCRGNVHSKNWAKKVTYFGDFEHLKKKTVGDYPPQLWPEIPVLSNPIYGMYDPLEITVITDKWPYPQSLGDHRIQTFMP